MDDQILNAFAEGVKHGQAKQRFSQINQWCLKRTPENASVVNDYVNQWFAANGLVPETKFYNNKGYVSSDGCYFENVPENTGNPYWNYQEISYDDFRLFVLNEPPEFISSL